MKLFQGAAARIAATPPPEGVPQNIMERYSMAEPSQAPGVMVSSTFYDLKHVVRSLLPDVCGWHSRFRAPSPKFGSAPASSPA